MQPNPTLPHTSLFPSFYSLLSSFFLFSILILIFPITTLSFPPVFHRLSSTALVLSPFSHSLRPLLNSVIFDLFVLSVLFLYPGASIPLQLQEATFPQLVCPPLSFFSHLTSLSFPYRPPIFLIFSSFPCPFFSSVFFLLFFPSLSPFLLLRSMTP